MVRVLIPSGALGLNYDKIALQRGIDARPDIIAIDGGSTDSGPSYLGRAVSKYARASTKVEWAGLMEARAQAGCPLVIGTAGTCGADAAVDWMLDITREIAAEQGRPLKIAVLRSQQNPDDMVRALAAGQITPLSNAPEISEETIDRCSNIVALAGAEQIAAALETDADIIIAGRTTDTAIIAALPLMEGCDAGAAWHGAKIGECGALCATNPQSGVILVDFDNAGFTVTPLADGAHASPHTVSAHMLYENSDPFILFEPGGHLDVTDARYTALDDTRVRVTGSKWVPSDQYTVKLEGARPVGFQTVLMAILRDARYVAHAAEWAADIEAKCTAKTCERLGLSVQDFNIELRLMGQSASFGELESRMTTPTEIGVVGIVTAPTDALSMEIGKLLNPYMLHHPLTADEEQPTFAFLFSPAEMPRGQTYEFALNHVLTLDDPMQAFALEVLDI
ncbi:acyclic terpene utilization AtuA family protein [Sulfitobacter sp. MF3-043]|uniref:acyclic terpene utilization AtuA family protein n=1 Tax=Sulfitobacter sediminivivens TaxID=3252902 RepID=UPI0036DAF662